MEGYRAGIRVYSDGEALVGYSENLLGLRVATRMAPRIMEAEAWVGGGYDTVFAVESDGDVLADGSFTGPADFAEVMSVAGEKGDYEPGDVLVIGPDGDVTRSTKAYATELAGVYSTKPGFVGDTEITRQGIEAYDEPERGVRIPVALLGIVPAKVSAENGAIHPGDLLTTSSTAGHAMKASPVVINGIEIYPTGTILGKALESLEQGTGVIKVLVTLR